ncbi:hypothetical protein BDW59DRAFT_158366 [Aspergillus cavernicola]|uniref:GPI inositol-deacylase winged helix domain-containing protein n=1 Tax=Aspergillus cavernicola TaxID=176166 RepID=A0ABR4IS12_9EURO
MANQIAARTIFQWIGCAAHPLKKEELLKVLVIELGTKVFSKGHRALRDLQRTRGPFIEVNNGLVQFVHFTAKEYIFGVQSKNYLSAHIVHWQIASTCLTYLCFNSFDGIFSPTTSNPEKPKGKIISGQFVLFQYAATNWLPYLRRCLGAVEQADFDSLSSLMVSFLSLRKNHALTVVSVKQSSVLVYPEFESQPEVQALLARLHDFENGLENGTIDNAKERHVPNKYMTSVPLSNTSKSDIKRVLKDAVRRDQVGLVDKLFQLEATPDDLEWEELIMVATQHASTAMVKLIERAVVQKWQSMPIEQASLWAISGEKPETVRYLVVGADIKLNQAEVSPLEKEQLIKQMLKLWLFWLMKEV